MKLARHHGHLTTGHSRPSPYGELGECQSIGRCPTCSLLALRPFHTIPFAPVAAANKPGGWPGDFSSSPAQPPKEIDNPGERTVSPLWMVSTLARRLDMLTFHYSTLALLLQLILYLLLKISLITYGKIICDSYRARRKHVQILHLPAAKRKEDDRGETCRRAF